MLLFLLIYSSPNTFVFSRWDGRFGAPCFEVIAIVHCDENDF